MNLKTNVLKISLPKIVGKGYKDYWNFKGRYRVCKGSRASKKSKTTALNFIYRIMKYPQSNLLVVRKVFRTLKDSAYTDLRWAIRQLHVEQYWEYKESPLELMYKPTGQKILFRGLDEPMKLTSITVDVGHLCWAWIEEAYEITKESDFDTLDESIRGQVTGELFKQITLTFNPWNEGHWIKKKFFDAEPNNDILAKTTNYLCNEFLDISDLKLFERMKRENPKRYKVAGLGDWGISEGLIYENWEEREFDIQEVLKIPDIESAFGLDFGYTNDPSALFAGLISKKRREIYVIDELYKKALTNNKLAEEIKNMGYGKERITADSAEPKSIDELYDLGLKGISGARKGKDSINNGIQFIQGYKIIIHPRCVNFLTEISNYTWAKDKFDKPINKPIDMFNHLMDAMRYALEKFMEGETFSFD
ncbi:MAG: PBSX family phage terminase large subunit [Fusobacterium sp.]|nr:PBSX family phage terminase large subunit [Fusobacterium sp.]